MQHSYLLIPLALLFIVQSLTAQYEIRTEDRQMVLGTHQSIIVKLPGADARFAERSWKEFAGQFGKVQNVKKSDQMLTQSVSPEAYSNLERVQLYAEVIDNGEGNDAELALWIEEGTTFVNANDHPGQHSDGIELLQDFANKTEIDLVNIELEDSLKILSKSESDLERLKKRQEQYEETISTSKEKVAQAESDMEANVKEQEATSAEIDRVRSSGGPDAEKSLKKLEKELSKLQKKNLSYVNIISTNKSRVEQATADLEQNAAEQEATSRAIDEQQAAVQMVRDKLDAVKAKRQGQT